MQPISADTMRPVDHVVSLFRSSKDRKAREAGVDESRIPPGQYYTDKWPVLHAGSVPKVDLAGWDFRVFGLVKEPIRLSFDELVGSTRRSRTATSTASPAGRSWTCPGRACP